MARVHIAMFALLAACSISEKHYVGGDAAIDAVTGPFACAGKPLPTTAPATVTLTGSVTNPINNQKLTGVTVEFRDSNDVLVASNTTDGMGIFIQTLQTNGVPISGHLKVSLSGYMTTFLYPSRPLDRDQPMLPVPVTTTAEMTMLASIGGVTYDSASALYSVAALDCDNGRVAAATITTNPQGMLRYLDANGAPSSTLTATSTFGGAMVFNIAAGNALVTGQTGDGIPFRSLSANGTAGAWTLIGLLP